MSITRLEIEQNCILFALSGSHAYGLQTPQSDNDYKGITVAPRRFYVGFHTFEQKDKGWETEIGIFPEHDPHVDSTIYEIRRFLRMTADQNPNILEMLWQRPESYLRLNKSGEMLIARRKHFLTKKVAKSFSGYARGQIQRMLVHRKWLLGEVPTKPDVAAYGIDASDFPLSHDHLQRFLEFLHLLIKDRIGYFEESRELYTLLNDIDFKQSLKQYPLPLEPLVTDMVQEMTRGSKDFMSLLHRSQQYHVDRKHYEAYRNWKITRNAVRGALEAKCGYDGKNISHCLRLLFMGYEALTKHTLTVNRKDAGDADFLLAVKQGNVPYKELDALSTEWFDKVNQVYETSSLQTHIDDNLINLLCMGIVEQSGVLTTSN